jgi:hypothetical protein
VNEEAMARVGSQRYKNKSRREWSALRSGYFTQAKNTGTYWRGGWVCPRFSVDSLKKREIIVPVGIQTTDLLACILVTTLISFKLKEMVNDVYSADV